MVSTSIPVAYNHEVFCKPWGVCVCIMCKCVCVVYNKIIVFYHLGEVKHLHQNISQSCIFVCLCMYLCEAVKVITSYGGVWKPLI